MRSEVKFRLGLAVGTRGWGVGGGDKADLSDVEVCVWVSECLCVCGGVFGRVGMCTAPKEYLGDVDGHAPRLGNS